MREAHIYIQLVTAIYIFESAITCRTAELLISFFSFLFIPLSKVICISMMLQSVENLKDHISGFVISICRK